MELSKLETEQKIKFLDLLDKARDRSHDLAMEAEAELRSDLQRDLDYREGIMRQSMDEETDILNERISVMRKAEKDAMQEREREAEKYRQVWSTALGNVTSDLARGLADVLFAGKNFGSAMVDIAKQTARSMFEAFMVGVLTPLTSALGNLGASLGAKISGIFGGGGGGGVGGAATSAIGGGLLSKIPGLGGLFGGGAAAAGAAASTVGAGTGVAAGSFGMGMGGTGGGLGGALGLGGGSGLFGLGAATIPVIGAGVFGVTKLITSLVGRGRRTADAFTSQIQGPFDEFLRNATTREQLAAGWEEFNRQREAFIAQGGDRERLVATRGQDVLADLVQRRMADLPSTQQSQQQQSPVQVTQYITPQPTMDTNALAQQIIQLLSTSGAFREALAQQGVQFA